MRPITTLTTLLGTCLVAAIALLHGCSGEAGEEPGPTGTPTGCNAGLQCPGETPLCQPKTGSCVECRSAPDCPPTSPLCHPEQGRCVACVTGAHCPADQTCVGGSCSAAPPCEPGAKVCNAHEVWTCHPDGRGYDTLPCPVTCVDGRCALCPPGETRCEDGNVEVCDAGGFAWLHQAICEDTCVSGQCLACFPGQTRCDGDAVEVCGEDGQTWSGQQNCWEQGEGLMCLSGHCVDPCSSDYKLNTNMGCEYWAVDLDQTFEGDSHNSPFAIVVSNVNAHSPALVSLYRNGELEDEVEVGASDLHIFNVSPHNVDGSMKDTRAFRLRSTRPIVAYQFNPLENVGVFSNDASMLIPHNSLGTTYRVLGWPERPGQLHGYLTVVATEDQTDVTVQVTANTAAGPGGVPALSPGETWTTTLGAYGVLSVETNGAGEDLSGTLVTSTRPIAVFSGHECANVPDTTACAGGICTFAPLWTCSGPEDCPAICCCDHLEEQLFPISAWGKTYVGARSTPRGLESDHWRVVASEDDTVVILNPPVAVSPPLGAGEVFEFPAVDSFVLTSDKPVMLGQFLASEYAPGVSAGICNSGGFFGSCSNQPGELCLSNDDCVADAEPGDAGIGDPAFVLAVPVEQLRDEYVFLVPNKYADDHLTLYAPLDTSVALDGQTLDGQGWQFIALGWRALHLPVSDGVHRLQGTGAFGVMVHGYDSFVSYAYPGGMNVGVLSWTSEP